jgi:hypothetical protein
MPNDAEHHDNSRPDVMTALRCGPLMKRPSPAWPSPARERESTRPGEGEQPPAPVADSPPSAIGHPSLLAEARLVPRVGGQRATRAKGAQDLDCCHPQSGPSWAHRMLGLCFRSFVVGKGVWCVVARSVRQGWFLWASVTMKSASSEPTSAGLVEQSGGGVGSSSHHRRSIGGDDDFKLIEPLLSTEAEDDNEAEARARRARHDGASCALESGRSPECGKVGEIQERRNQSGISIPWIEPRRPAQQRRLPRQTSFRHG